MIIMNKKLRITIASATSIRKELMKHQLSEKVIECVTSLQFRAIDAI